MVTKHSISLSLMIPMTRPRPYMSPPSLSGLFFAAYSSPRLEECESVVGNAMGLSRVGDWTCRVGADLNLVWRRYYLITLACNLLSVEMPRADPAPSPDMTPSSPASSSSSLPSSNVLLALPDGPIPYDHADARSHTISLIGGYPTFPPLGSQDKAPEDIRCGVCHQAIPLLAQVYCPPEDGENDRTVYVWACARTSCQRRDGR